MLSLLRLTNTSMRIYLSSFFIYVIIISCFCVTSTRAVDCFECFDTGPTNKNCTRQKMCSGAACLIFESGDNTTTSAFCLLTSEHVAMNRVSPGCWVEADGKSKHCVCFTDFCNELRDRTVASVSQDPLSTPLKSLEILKHNPFLDYDDLDLDDAETPEDKLHVRPAPQNLLFPSALEEDRKTAGDDTDDLVPIDFEEYTNGESLPPIEADDIFIEPNMAAAAPPMLEFYYVMPLIACFFTAILRL